MSNVTFTDVLRIEVAALQAAYPERLGDIARAHAAIIEGHVIDTHDGNGKVLSRNGNTWYTTNGVCTCQAAAFGQPCRHLSAWKLYKHVAKKFDAQQEPVMPTPEPLTTQSIPKEYIVTIQGKPFVKFAGLLELAHQRGIQGLEVTFTYNDPELALAQATAVFPFGTFTDVGDASPGNTNQKVRAHFRRVAATRASARALRLALNITMVAVEELAEE